MGIIPITNRWWMIAFAFLGIIICYVDRSALSYAIQPLRQDLQINDSQFGFLASAFGVGYLFMNFLGGVLADRFGACRVWSISAIIWSLAMIAFGFGHNFATLLVLRFVLGAAEGPVFPSFVQLVKDWLPINQRGRAVSFGVAAVPFASVVGAPLTSLLILHSNWQYTFIILGSVGLFWGFFWLFVLKTRAQLQQNISNNEVGPILPGWPVWKFLLTNRSLLINNYAYFAYGYLLFFGVNWLPDYLGRIYQLDLKSVGILLTLPWLVATVTIIVGGILSDYIWQKTQSIRKSRSLLIAAGLLLSGVAFMPPLFFHKLWIALFSICAAFGFALFTNSSFYSVNIDLAPEHAATSFGIMNGCSAAAAIISPLVTGYLVSLTGNFHLPFIVMMVLVMSASVAIFFFQKPDSA